MVMDKYYPQDHLQEIWQKIGSLHMSYLEMEESTQKLEQRIKLEECINNYLCNAPHNQKFLFKQTMDVLYRSACSKKDFSGYRAALGWNAIGMYAGNLLSQPWRKEYREIKMYSGFYKHEIESNLLGAEIMFEAMGYRQVGNGILVLDGPICPDQVSNVSQDSLVAYVECQILKAIWEEVSTVYNISWLEVLKFRESHLCSPKQSVSSLIYLYHQQKFQEKINTYPTTTNMMCTPKLHNIHPQVYPAMPPPPQHSMPCVYATPTNCCSNNYMTYSPHYSPYMPINYLPMKPQYNTYKYNPVPTAQLIELDQHTYEAPDVSRRYDANTLYDDTDRKMRMAYDNHRKTPTDSKHSEESGTIESWDYVYRNLESQGYSKDLGGRGDLLSQQLPEIEEIKSKHKSHHDKSDRKDYKKTEISNVYDNLPESSSRKHSVAVSKTMASNKSDRKSNGFVKEKSKPAKNQVEVDGHKESKSTWHCNTCTFLNTAAKDICEMCGKSRNIPVEEIAVGGAECVQCTYVNSKEREKCEVCGGSLNDSPTYI